jgi:hypothetical protein
MATEKIKLPLEPITQDGDQMISVAIKPHCLPWRLKIFNHHMS